MKRILSLTVLFCAVAASAFASAPEAALRALALGNEKFVLEQSLESTPLAIIIADPSISVPTADLFGLSESRLVVIKPEGAFGAEAGLAVQETDLTAPVVIVLGLDQESVWAVYARTLQKSPALIHAVLKGQIAALGAVVDAQSGAVSVLGTHPELQTLVGQYLLGLPSETQTQPAVAADAAPAEKGSADAATHAADEAQAAQKSGGSGFMFVILFIAAIIGVVIFMDKTVLKP